MVDAKYEQVLKFSSLMISFAIVVAAVVNYITGLDVILTTAMKVVRLPRFSSKVSEIKNSPSIVFYLIHFKIILDFFSYFFVCLKI
jgi:hypothetical protein